MGYLGFSVVVIVGSGASYQLIYIQGDKIYTYSINIDSLNGLCALLAIILLGLYGWRHR